MGVPCSLKGRCLPTFLEPLIRPHPEPLPHQLSFLELISALHEGQYNLLYLLRTCSISLQLYSPEIALCPTLP